MFNLVNKKGYRVIYFFLSISIVGIFFLVFWKFYLLQYILERKYENIIQIGQVMSGWNNNVPEYFGFYFSKKVDRGEEVLKFRLHNRGFLFLKYKDEYILVPFTQELLHSFQELGLLSNYRDLVKYSVIIKTKGCSVKNVYKGEYDLLKGGSKNRKIISLGKDYFIVLPQVIGNIQGEIGIRSCSIKFYLRDANSYEFQNKKLSRVQINNILKILSRVPSNDSYLYRKTIELLNGTISWDMFESFVPKVIKQDIDVKATAPFKDIILQFKKNGHINYIKVYTLDDRVIQAENQCLANQPGAFILTVSTNYSYKHVVCSLKQNVNLSTLNRIIFVPSAYESDALFEIPLFLNYGIMSKQIVIKN